MARVCSRTFLLLVSVVTVAAAVFSRETEMEERKRERERECVRACVCVCVRVCVCVCVCLCLCVKPTHCSSFLPDTYHGAALAEDLARADRNSQDKGATKHSLYLFGLGRGGGGPTADMLFNLERLRSFPPFPTVRRACAIVCGLCVCVCVCVCV
jgi:hypothetical protein